MAQLPLIEVNVRMMVPAFPFRVHNEPTAKALAIEPTAGETEPERKFPVCISNRSESANIAVGKARAKSVNNIVRLIVMLLFTVMLLFIVMLLSDGLGHPSQRKP